MGFALVLFFFLGGLWILLEFVIGFLPKIRRRSARIGLVAAVTPLSFFLMAFTSVMMLGLVRGGEIPAEFGQAIAISSLVLVFVFPAGITFIAIQKYSEIQSNENLDKNSGTPGSKYSG